LPSGSRHELAALAFSVAARRAGLPVLYLGPDLPPDEWVAFLRRVQPRAAVIGSPTRRDVGPAIEVARAIRAADPALVLAFGGRFAPQAAAGAPQPDRVVVLPDGVGAAVEMLRDALAASPASRTA